ncbi:hypothetical protein NPIL_472261 [Nephila pilipes]|uniref:Uncharacterized protein n=1 Tax=Nephila pilipes TaxID=299642 RepID=A0A8X6MT17_NEPPI|nr:hypothetical protein NPIL_472261 [Nephila pilipes]
MAPVIDGMPKTCRWWPITVKMHLAWKTQALLACLRDLVMIKGPAFGSVLKSSDVGVVVKSGHLPSNQVLLMMPIGSWTLAAGQQVFKFLFHAPGGSKDRWGVKNT